MFRSSERYGTFNSYDALKLVALAAMIADHLGFYLLPEVPWLRDIGRIAFPIFLYLVGYSASWKPRHDVIIWGSLVVAGCALTHHAIFPLNILMTIAVTRMLLSVFVPRIRFTPLGLTGVFLALVVWYPVFFWCDYSTVAVLFAISGYLERQFPGSIKARAFLSATMALHLYLEMAIFGLGHMPGMCLALALTLYLVWGFRIKPVGARLIGEPDLRVLKFLSRNTLPIYGLHVILFMVLEHFYFPERTAFFRWF